MVFLISSTSDHDLEIGVLIGLAKNIIRHEILWIRVDPNSCEDAGTDGVVWLQTKER